MALYKCDSFTDENGKELLSHGNTLLPIAAYDDNISEMSVNWHWHDELEMGIITSGTVIISTESGQYKLETGQGFFIGPTILHQITTDSDSGEEAKLHAIVFHSNIVSGKENSIFYEKYIRPISENTKYDFLILDKKKDSEIIAYIQNIWENVKEEPEDFEIEVRYHLSRIMSKIVTAFSTQENEYIQKIRGAARVKLMLSYIHIHYHEKITLDEIANAANISDSEALRSFNMIMNVTPVKYLIDYRLTMAEKLIKTTNLKITEISDKCGFSDISYFTKKFRQKYNISPAKYRIK